MTGYTVHSGTTIKFSEGWARIFEEQASKSKKTEKPAKKTASSSTAKSKVRAKRAVKKKR